MSSSNEQEQDYYTLFGVARDATLAEIRASYRRLMQQAGMHPDLGGDTRTAALINGAFAVLRDPDQRELYDARLEVLSRIAAGVEIETEPAMPHPGSSCLFCEQPHNYVLDGSDDVGCGTCGSPLQPVDNSRIDPHDTRAVERIGKTLDLLVYTHWGQPKGYAATTSDVSPHGLQLTTRHELRPGQRVRIASQLLEAVGRVTHYTRQDDGWRCTTVAGVSFLTLRFLRPVGGFVSRRA